MSLAINLSPSLTELLKSQAASLSISINELIEKLIYRGLSQKDEDESVAADSATVTQDSVDTEISSPPFTMAEIIARARSRPPNPNSVRLPTGTLDDVLAAREKNPRAQRLSAEEWEEHWWPIRQEMKERDRMKKYPIDKIIQDHLSQK